MQKPNITQIRRQLDTNTVWKLYKTKQSTLSCTAMWGLCKTTCDAAIVGTAFEKTAGATDCEAALEELPWSRMACMLHTMSEDSSDACRLVAPKLNV